jgi:hypothetical protein
MKHIVILKAKEGEFNALKNLDASTSDRVIPFFDIGRITADTYARQYMQKSSAPISTYLDRVITGIYSAWPTRPAMIDMYQWKPDASVEGGSHVLAYVVDSLSKMGMPVLPVIGYDRWQDAVYRQSFIGILQGKDYNCCIRLDSTALEDLAEPDLLRDNLQSIVDALGLFTDKCYILIDFDDVSVPQKSVETLLDQSRGMLAILENFAFKNIIIAGCSIPKTIDLAVQKRDSVSTVIRKEMLVWQTLRLERPERPLLTGDYGVRGPTTIEAPSRYTNGKIRYAVKGAVFIARGHPFSNDGNHSQMHGLATIVAASNHFLSGQFSWGDSQILIRMASLKPGSPSDWIAIDTNHHLSFVVSEAEEFEQSLLITAAKKGKA